MDENKKRLEEVRKWKKRHGISNIRRMLDERGIRQTKVAEKLSVSKCAFNNMLSGRRIIRAEYIPIIAQALGCTCNDIFRVPKDDEKAAQ